MPEKIGSAISVFETRKLKDIYEEIKSVYLSDARPWVIGYSGGKDSTTALQLIYYSLSELSPNQLKKKVYVISSDTLVETPVIVGYIRSTLDRVAAAAREKELPIETAIVTPQIGSSFWVNLIGRGYPTPSQRFRWCTDRMKIDPANRFILERVSEYGEVVVVLGVRKSESTTRAQVMNLHKIPGKLLSRHSSLPNAYVYTPVQDFNLNDVWTYLLQVPSPWGSNNRDLVTLYRNSQSGECPLVVDTTTPSCGNSRFGCWVCTVVQTNHSLEGMIEEGKEEWMQPLLEFRNLLASTQEDKAKYRNYKRRDGHVILKNDGEGLIRGPYYIWFRQELLSRLLKIQKEIRSTGPDPNLTLILPEEIQEIRRIWRMEEQDWEDSVPRLYREATGEDLDWIDEDSVRFSSKDKEVLESISLSQGIPVELVMKLIDEEKKFDSMSRRAGVFERIHTVLGEVWKDEAEMTRVMQERQQRMKDLENDN
jgi:DNA sulfur modification protein DndC